MPLTLLATPDDAEAVVLEMGTNEPGEIATLAAIARPDVGVVTTVGEAHLEKLGSLDGRAPGEARPPAGPGRGRPVRRG